VTDPVAEDGATGQRLHDFVRELFPIRRSLTGDGVRATLAAVGRHIPLEIREVPTGTPAFDWTVPKEWNLRDAYIVGPDGRRVVDAAESSLHVVGYSTPVRERMSLAELRPHLHTLPDRPDWIPYRTSYYAEAWGFCLTHRQSEALVEGEYEVVIDATLAEGSLTYGEYALAGDGDGDDEILVTAHVCHPAQANDNLSGIAVATFLAAELAGSRRRRSYRFLFIPGTIGSLTWLSQNEDRLGSVGNVLVLAGVGDAGPITYKRSRDGSAEIDQAVEQVLHERGGSATIEPFAPWGYDERQFNSPGIGLAAGLLMRTPHGTYPEYHTSADDLDFVRPEGLADSLSVARAILGVLDGNATYRNLSPKGEPQLGKRGLYGSTGGAAGRRPEQLPMLWVLNQSDGSHSLLDIARRSGLAFDQVRVAADALAAAGLLEPVERARSRP
jgi:aminopeptidase-like protein